MTSALPTPHTLQVRRYTPGGADAHGNPTVTYGDASDWPVHYVVPKTTTPDSAAESTTSAHRDLDTTELSVAAPNNALAPSISDRVVVGEHEFQVIGLEAYDQGPWPHPTADLVVTMRHVEG